MAAQKNDSWRAYLAVSTQAYESGDYQRAEVTLKDNLEQLRIEANNAGELSGHTMHLLANVYRDQDKFDEANELYHRALEMRANESKASTALLRLLRDYSLSFCMQGKFSHAHLIERRALTLAEKLSDVHKFEVNTSLARLCALCRVSFDYSNAEIYYRRCLSQREPSTELSQSIVLPLITDLAIICYRQSKFVESETFYLRALQILESEETESAEYAAIYNQLGLTLCAQGKISTAQHFCHEASRIRSAHCSEQQSEPNCINDLADIYCGRGRNDAARAMCEDALTSRELPPAESKDSLVNSLNMYVQLMKRLNFCEKTDKLEGRISRLQKQVEER